MAGKRILMWLENNTYPQDSRVRREATTLAGAGYDVTVVCPKRGRQPLRDQVDGVHVLRYPEVRGGRGLAGFVFEYAASMLATFFLSVWHVIRKGADVIHAHNPPDTFALISVPFKLAGIRFVFDHHDLSPEMYDARFEGDSSRLVRRVLLLMERITFRLADHVIATNDSYRRIAIERGKVSPEGVTVVRNGPELDRVKPTPPDPQLRDRAGAILGYVGQMGPQDGVDHLVRAVHHLVHDFGRHDLLCVIMGTGEALDGLRSLVSELDLDRYVELTGVVSDQQLMSWLSTADVCVVPDPSNPFTDRSTMVKMSEYMALGKPIVAYDLPEHRVTAQEAALYACPNDPWALAKSVDELLEDPDRQAAMSSFGRRRALDVLAWSHQAPLLVGAYDTLLAEPNGRRRR